MRRTKLLKPFVMLLMLTMAMLVPQTVWAEDVVQVASGEDLIAAIVDNNATNVPVTIQFTQDIEVSSDIEINGMQNITFDLNGHKFVFPGFYAYGKAVLKNGTVYSADHGIHLSGGEIDLLNIDIFARNNLYLSGNSKLNIYNNVNITCPETVVYVANGSLNINGICSFITTGQVNAIYKDQGSVNVGFNYRLTAVDGEEIELNNSWGKSVLCVYNGACTTAASHNAVHHAAVTSATCLEAVHAEYYSCSKCGRFFSDDTCTETVSELTFSQGSHSYGELIEATEATCTSSGTIAHYECAACHNLFDADKNLVYDIKSADPLGHDFDADGICQREGCDEHMDIIALHSGVNNVNVPKMPWEDWVSDNLNSAYYVMCTYKVKADGKVAFKIQCTGDMTTVLYDSQMQNLYYTLVASNTNEYAIDDAKAGDVYYVGVRGYFENNINPCTITVEANVPECAPGEHELTPHEGVPATCTTAGKKAYYECSKCEKSFADAEGTEEITDLTIPALGHDLDADGKCQHDGCDYAISPLVAGDNDVVIVNPTTGSAWEDDQKNPEHYTLFKLVAAEDNGITIKGVGDLDTYGVLYDAGVKYIKYSDDDDEGNFKFVIQDAKAGDVYYIGARGYDDDEIGEYVINVIYGPVEDDGPDGPDGPVDISGTITVGGTSVDITDGDEVYNFNSENEGKMSMEIAVVEDLPHFVLKLNNAEITAGAIDDGGAIGIDYFGSVPLIINLTGKNSIKFSDVTGTAMGVYTESELMFTGTGSLDINCADGTAPVFVGIAADDLITYSQKFADNISSSPMGLSFNGSININGKTQMAALGLLANDNLLLTSGEFNINTESALQVMTAGMIVKAGEIGLMNTKVKINSNLAGIAFAAPVDEEPDAEPAALVAKKLMPKKSSRKAKAGKKKINIIGTPGCDLFVANSDIEIDAAVAAIVNARQNPSCMIAPASTPGGVAHIAAGTSKETAEDQVIDGDIDIFAEAAGMNYLHIYETGEAIMNVHLYDTEAARDQYLTEKFDECPSYYDLFTSEPAYLDFTLHRTFEDDGWYTLCLPFDLEVAGSPFSKAAHFAGIDISGVQFSLGFNTVDKMIAGIPYLVKVDHTVQNPEFKNIKFNYVKPGYEAYTDDYMETDVAFNGSFDPVETFGGYFAGVGAGNKVNGINDGTKIRGFRGFFTLPAPYVKLVGGNGGDGPIVIEAKKITFTINGEIEGAATDIDPDLHVERNAGNDKTYNVMGQRVNKNAKGLIIRNGKTIFKK